MMKTDEKQFQVNLPYSRASMPSHFINSPSAFSETRVRRPIIPQRKFVNSFIRPSLADLCREEIKRNMRNNLLLKSAEVKPAEQIKPIPRKDLFSVIDK